MNSSEKKKKKEYEQLRIIHPESIYKDVLPSEKPDFILTDKNNLKFGVEVTDYYQNDTSGRFKNIPNYVDRIVNKSFIHKEDIGILTVPDKVEIQDKDGKWRDVGHTGVMQQTPQSIDRINALKILVANKSSKFSTYNKDLSAIDLIIIDHGDLVAELDIQKTQILAYLRMQEKANTLVSSFRNIMLVIKDQSNLITIKLKSS